MSKPTRSRNHPVWDVYDAYRDSKLWVLYYSEKLDRHKRLNSFIEIILAITTSSSAVAALWLWDTALGREIWKYVLAASAILAIIKPIIKLTEKVQRYEEVLSGYRGLENDLKIIIIQIKQSRKYGIPHRTKLTEAVSRQGELQKKNPEAKHETSLIEKCRSQVKKDFPPEHFFIPKDK